MYQVNCYLENGDKMVYPKVLETKRQADILIGALSCEDDLWGLNNKYEIVEISVDKTPKI